MEESVYYYLDHYFHMPDFLWFFLITLGVLLVILGFMWMTSFGKSGDVTIEETNADTDPEVEILSESLAETETAEMKKIRQKQAKRAAFEKRAGSFFELIFCGGAILGFMATYYLINRFVFDEPFRTFWDTYNDYLLLALIIVFILLNRLVDNVLIRLHISHEDKTAVRLVSMAYMLIIFFYIKFIYENDNYDMFITYYLGLMIGRFVYFDVSFGDFLQSVKSACRNLPVLVLALAGLAALSYIGFGSGYLIKHIGVVTNVFFIHLFMSLAIGVVYYAYRIFFRKK